MLSIMLPMAKVFFSFVQLEIKWLSKHGAGEDGNFSERPFRQQRI